MLTFDVEMFVSLIETLSLFNIWDSLCIGLVAFLVGMLAPLIKVMPKNNRIMLNDFMFIYYVPFCNACYDDFNEVTFLFVATSAFCMFSHLKPRLIRVTYGLYAANEKLLTKLLMLSANWSPKLLKSLLIVLKIVRHTA